MVTATERGWQVFYRWMLRCGGKAFGFCLKEYSSQTDAEYAGAGVEIGMRVNMLGMELSDV